MSKRRPRPEARSVPQSEQAVDKAAEQATKKSGGRGAETSLAEGDSSPGRFQPPPKRLLVLLAIGGVLLAWYAFLIYAAVVE